MISRSLSSDERSPPLASGWWRFTSALNRALIVGAVALDLEPEHVEALRSALRTCVLGAALGARRRPRRAELAEQVERIAAPPPKPPDRARPALPPVAHLPGRPMAGDGVLLVPGDVVGRSCRRSNCTNDCIRARGRGRTANTPARAAGPWARDGSPARRSPATRSTGASARSRAVLAGLTRMRSKRASRIS